MTSREFCYWLQGYFEIESLVSNRPELPTLTAQQVVMVKNHLQLVFKHEIDPSYKPQTVASHQQDLQQTHDGFPSMGKTDPSGVTYRC